MNQIVLWLRTNTGLKVVALLLATFIWFFVKAVTSERRTVEGVQLELRTRPGTVAQTNTRYINVVVSGAQEDLRQASRNDLFGVVDLTDEKATGRILVTLEPRMIRHPRRVKVEAVEPTEIVVRVDPVAE